MPSADAQAPSNGSSDAGGGAHAHRPQEQQAGSTGQQGPPTASPELLALVQSGRGFMGKRDQPAGATMLSRPAATAGFACCAVLLGRPAGQPGLCAAQPRRLHSVPDRCGDYLKVPLTSVTLGGMTCCCHKSRTQDEPNLETSQHARRKELLVAC
eukprot:scaffold70932_cov21-Tisochrysis_lutea.AAC.1